MRRQGDSEASKRETELLTMVTQLEHRLDEVWQYCSSGVSPF